ncbi:crossover junction endodeoxyribonuclease RuvC [bacterium]|nr:MAG: crossover junction endodeoxyribonuclease RuvC [bacterium]
MTILGIDPGTATTGFGIINQNQSKKSQYDILEFGVISTSKKESDQERLKTLYEDLNFLIKKYKPKKLGVEKLFFTTNQKTAMAVSQARGVVLLAAVNNGLEISEFTPLQVKNILCGYGKADKKQVQFMIKQTFGLKNTPKPDDAADALAIALCTAWARSK